MGRRSSVVRRQKLNSDFKESVRAVVAIGSLPAYTSDGQILTADAAGALPAQDGVTLVAGDHVALDAASPHVDVGLYVMTQEDPFQFTRRSDFDASEKVTAGAIFKVEEGAIFGGTTFELLTPNPIILNTTLLDFDVQAAGGGGSGAVQTTIPTGESVIVPDNSELHYTNVLRISGGKLTLQGNSKAKPVKDPENQAIARVPVRSTRVIPQNDIQYYDPRDLDNDGNIQALGDLVPFPILDGTDILDALTVIAPDTPALLGVSSPAGFIDPADVRTMLDVLTTSEVSTAAQSAVTRFAGLTEVSISGPGPVAVTAGNIYQLGGGDIDITLPAGGSTGDTIGFWGLQNDVATFDGNGNQVGALGTSAPTVAIEITNEIIYAVYDNGNTRWNMYCGPQGMFAGQSPYQVIASDSQGRFAPQEGGAYLAKSDTGPVTATTVVGESNRTVRFRVIDAAARTLQLPDPSSFEDGTRVAFQHWGEASNVVTINFDGNGEQIQGLGDPTTSSGSLTGTLTASLLVVFRWVSEDIGGNERWVIEYQSGILDSYKGLAEQTLVDAATVAYDVSAGRNANVTLTADRVINWTNPVAGQRGTVRVVQDGVGGHSITAYQLAGVAGDVLFAGGVAPTLTGAASAQDVLEWYYDGTQLHVRVFSLDSQ